MKTTKATKRPMKTTKATKRPMKTKAQWQAELDALRQDRDRANEAELAACARASEAERQLAKANAELAMLTAVSAQRLGEAEALKLAMRMLANTIIGKETYSSWPWAAPEQK